MDSLITSIGKLCVSFTIPLVTILSIIYVLRRYGKRKDKNHLINIWNRRLRKVHIPLGIILMIVSLIHGLTSSISVFSINWGTVCFVLILILGLSYMLGEKLKRPGWMRYHRILTILLIIALFLHLMIKTAFKL